MLGKSPHSLGDSRPSRSHQVTVSGLPAGKYFFQVVAVSEGGFSSEDDNGGKCYEISVARCLSERAEALTTFENAVPAETARGSNRPLEEQAL
jgi:hypothetical protein